MEWISEPVGQQRHSSVKVDGGRTMKKEDQDAGLKSIRVSCSTPAGVDGRKNDTKWIAPGIKRGWEEMNGAENANPRWRMQKKRLWTLHVHPVCILEDKKKKEANRDKEILRNC